jgi:hypothetical protein
MRGSDRDSLWSTTRVAKDGKIYMVDNSDEESLESKLKRKKY